jgi:hypothetical protein
MIGVVRNGLLAGKVIRGYWRTTDSLSSVGYSILKNNNYKCYFCGVQSLSSKARPDGMMIPIDLKNSGLAAKSAKGAVCACPLCASAQSVNWSVVPTVNASGETVKSAGFLIYFPYKSQADVNRLAITTLVNSLKDNKDPLFSVATDVNVTMTQLANEVEKNIPIYRGNDVDFAKALASIPDQFYDKRQKIIGAIRWWPHLDSFAEFGRYVYAASLHRLEVEMALERKVVTSVVSRKR